MTNQLTPTAKAVSLVTMNGNVPVTTSVAIAQVLSRPHHGVIQLVHSHERELCVFERVAFEMQPFATCGGTQSREVAILNEQQATLLISFMSNTPKVVDFKIKLVKAFYDMRMKLEQDRKALPVFQSTEDIAEFICDNCPELKAKMRQEVALRRNKDFKDFEHVAHSMYVLKLAYKHIDEMYARIDDMNKCLRAAQTAMATLNAVKGQIFDMVDIAHQELGQCASAHPEIDELVRQKMMQ